MPRDQTSLNRGEYEPLWANCPPWHSEKKETGDLENRKQERGYEHTGAHVIGASCSEFLAERVGCGQTEIGDG